MEPDLIVSCPYNPAHRIRKYKLMSHMAKCKKSTNTENKIECPLDRSHVMDQEHIREHIACCTSLGKLIDTDIGHIKPEMETMPAIVEACGPTENWEEEPEVPSYDPMEVSSKKEVLRCVSGLSKSERRKFRDNERMRMANLKGVNTTDLSLKTDLVKDTVHEVPLRPPHDTSCKLHKKITQDDFDRNVCAHDHNISTQTKSSHKFDHNSFRKKLYDETASRCDDISQALEQSVYDCIDMSLDKSLHIHGACSREYLQYINKKKEDLPIFNQEDEETKVKTEIDSEMFNINNLGKQKSERFAGTSNADRVTDKLLALLKNHSDVKKVEPVKKTIDINQFYEKSGERGFTWDEDFNKFNDRLAYLTDIQNTAAEESAQLLKQLKELKLRRDTVPKK